MFDDLLSPNNDPFLRENQRRNAPRNTEAEGWDSGQPQQFWTAPNPNVWNNNPPPPSTGNPASNNTGHAGKGHP